LRRYSYEQNDKDEVRMVDRNHSPTVKAITNRRDDSG
jgi:hypothetical protein